MNTAAVHTSDYEFDFYGWTQHQAGLIRSGKLAELDLANILEEIETMGRSEKRELVNRLAVLLAHLLKWQFQSERRSKSWEFTIKEQQRMVERVLRENPSLKPRIPEIVEDAYDFALFTAARETGMLRDDFPQECPWTLDEALDFIALAE